MAEDPAVTPDASDESTDTAVATEEKPAQNVTVEDVGPARKKLIIEIPQERIQEKIEWLYGRIRTDAQIPGFRRGRAPQRLIEKRFGEDIRNDAKGQLLSEGYSQAIEEHDFDVLGEPDVKDVEEIELPESGPMKFEVEVEVSPDFEMPDLSEIKVEKPSMEVSDEDVTAELERYRERMGRMTPIEDEGTEIAEGDYVEVDAHVYAGHGVADDAEPLNDQHDTYVLVHGEEREFKGHVMGILVPDMGKRLTGHKAGETVTIEMTGPSGHEDEQVKDQPITLVLKLKGIERLEPVPMEQVIEQLGVETEDEVRDRVRQMLEQRAQQQAEAKMHEQAVDQLLEKIDLELPENLTSRQTEQALQRQRMEMLYQGTPPQEIEDRMAELRSESEDRAKRDLKRFFILDRIAKEKDVEVDQSEINQRVAIQAMQTGRRPERVRQEMQERGELQQLYLNLREHKTLEMLLEEAQVEETDAPADTPAEESKAE
ncbi:MAG: trigger factor [Phycisphaeraceae bacterium]